MLVHHVGYLQLGPNAVRRGHEDRALVLGRVKMKKSCIAANISANLF